MKRDSFELDGLEHLEAPKTEEKRDE